MPTKVLTDLTANCSFTKNMFYFRDFRFVQLQANAIALYLLLLTMLGVYILSSRLNSVLI